MRQVQRILWFCIIFLILGFIVYGFFNYYPYIFAKRVTGEIINVERVDVPMTILSRPGTEMNPQVFSFAVAVKDKLTNEIFTASSQDRQWAVVRAGQCAEVKLFPYAPWDFDRAGTYHNARLEKLYECPVVDSGN